MIRNTLKNKASQKTKLDFETFMKLVLFAYIDSTANGIRSKWNTCRGYFMAAREYDFFYLRVLQVSLTSDRSKQVTDTYSTRSKGVFRGVLGCP